MKILIIGSGGREHALAWKLAQSEHVTGVFVAPGNPGMSAVATRVPIEARDGAGLLKFALEKGMDLTVVGPDDALAAGLVDRVRGARGCESLGRGRRRRGWRASKVFAKEFMERHGNSNGAGGVSIRRRRRSGLL